MLTFTTIIPLITFAFVTSATPGPNNIMLMSSGMNFGFKSSIRHISGVVIGFPLMILLVGIGLIQIFERVPHSFTLLRMLSIGYLLYLAWRIATTQTFNSETTSTKPLGFVQAALFQWVNPKAWTMALTAISVYTSESRSALAVFIVAMAFVISGFFSCCAWTLMGFQLKRILNEPSKLHAVNLALAALLVATLFPMLINGYRD